jgi:hypothetical protein
MVVRTIPIQPIWNQNIWEASLRKILGNKSLKG